MAVDLWSENPGMGATIPPRISFSLDFDVVPIEHHPLRSTSSPAVDFDFCVFRWSLDRELSSADELFSEGKILPTQLKKKVTPPPPPSPQPTLLAANGKRNSKSSWRFMRSSSLNCGGGYARSFCHLPLLSRSNSTGSSSKDKISSSNSSTKQAQSSSVTGSHKKPPLKKNYWFHGNGTFRINPVLNVPPGNLFIIGSIFSGGKDKNKNKCLPFV